MRQKSLRLNSTDLMNAGELEQISYLVCPSEHRHDSYHLPSLDTFGTVEQVVK